MPAAASIPGPYHLFLSYSREDNKEPVNAAGQGWVAAFVTELKRRHDDYSGRELNIFFDRYDIDEGTDWKRRLGERIRHSRAGRPGFHGRFGPALNSEASRSGSGRA